MKTTENAVISIMIICASAIIISAMFFYPREEKPQDHSICAKAIELKVNEADSLRTELDDCRAVYIELNNGEKVKIIKP